MNYLKSAPFVILSLLLLCTSCSKDDDTSPQGTNPPGDGYFMTATIDGVKFSTNNMNVSADADEEEEYFMIGIFDNGDWITFSLDGPPTTGTFSPGPSETTSLIYLQLSSSVWGAEGDYGSGAVTITENTATYLKGTFSFTGVPLTTSSDSIDITEGSFKAQKL